MGAVVAVAGLVADDAVEGGLTVTFGDGDAFGAVAAPLGEGETEGEGEGFGVAPPSFSDFVVFPVALVAD